MVKGSNTSYLNYNWHQALIWKLSNPAASPANFLRDVFLVLCEMCKCWVYILFTLILLLSDTYLVLVLVFLSRLIKHPVLKLSNKISWDWGSKSYTCIMTSYSAVSDKWMSDTVQKKIKIGSVEGLSSWANFKLSLLYTPGTMFSGKDKIKRDQNGKRSHALNNHSAITNYSKHIL